MGEDSRESETDTAGIAVETHADQGATAISFYMI